MSLGRVLGPRCLTVLVLMLLIVPAAGSAALQEPPPLFRSSPARTGEVPGGAPMNNTTLWTFDTEDAVKSSPVVDGGRVYVGTMGGDVLCLDAYTGRKVWSYETGGPVESSPAIVDNMVYIGSDDAFVYCLDALDGSLIWRAETGGEIKSSPVVHEGRVFLGSNDFLVYALDADDGGEEWTFETGGYVYSSPSAFGDAVYFGSCDGNVYAVNATTGEKVWNYTADFCPASPAITEDLVIFGAYDGLLHYLNRSDGKQVHTVPVQFAEIYSSAGLFTYEYEQDYDLPMVFVATTGGKMLGIGPDGKEFWNATHEAGITSSPLVVTEVEEPYDPFIVYGDEGGRLHGVEIHNPYQVFHYTYVHSYVEWHVKLGSSIQSSPFLWHERVYVGVETADGGGRVVCLGGDIRDDEVVMTIGQPGSIFGIVGEGGTVEVHVTTYNFSPDRIDVTFDGTVRPASRNWSIEPYDPRADVWTVEFPATVPEGRRLVIARAYEDDVEVLVAVGEVMSLVEGWDSVDVTIDHPADGEVVTEPILVASGQASSNYTIWWVKYYFDEADFFSWRDCTGTENWTAAIETDRLDEGWHDLTIVANDYYRTGRLVVRIHIGELDDEEEEERIEPVEVILLIILIVVLVVLFRTKPPRVSEKASGH